MRITIVEDNRTLADGIAKAFEAEGHGVDQLHDGEEAEHFLRSERPDLIVLDINLPGKSGLEVLRGLRRRDSQVPVRPLLVPNKEQEAQRHPPSE